MTTQQFTWDQDVDQWDPARRPGGFAGEEWDRRRKSYLAGQLANQTWPLAGGMTAANTAGAGAPTINQSDWASTSSSGLPAWAEGWAQKMIGKNGNRAFKGYNKAIKGLNQAPELIEEQRALQTQQYGREIGDPTRRAVQNAIASAMGKGVGSSSMVGETMSGVGRELATGAQRANQDSNLWASSSLLKNLLDKVGANAGRAGMMGDILGLTRRSQSYTPNMMGMGFSPV